MIGYDERGKSHVNRRSPVVGVPFEQSYGIQHLRQGHLNKPTEQTRRSHSEPGLLGQWHVRSHYRFETKEILQHATAVPSGGCSVGDDCRIRGVDVTCVVTATSQRSSLT